MKAFRDGKYLHAGRCSLLLYPFVLSDHFLFHEHIYKIKPCKKVDERNLPCQVYVYPNTLADKHTLNCCKLTYSAEAEGEGFELKCKRGGTKKTSDHNLFLAFMPYNNTFGFAHASIHPRLRKHQINSAFLWFTEKSFRELFGILAMIAKEAVRANQR